MAQITVVEHMTLDGVVQSPASPDEDPSDGFTLGGWATPRVDQAVGEYLGRGMSAGGGLLLGRRTYEQFYGFWPRQTDNPYTDALNRQTKYVVSTTLADPPWENSVLLPDVDAVAKLKDSTPEPVTVLGSAALVASLRERDLVDRYVLMVHPVLLGSGRRLFSAGFPPVGLTLAESLTTPSGIVIAAYDRSR
jgi:dihydrofolate reductase